MKHFLTCFTFIIITVACFGTSFSLANAQAPSDTAGIETEAARGKFTPLVGIPYIDTTDSDLSLPKYVNALYKASISIAAFLAVVKIIFAGVKYMLSDVVTTKADAKKDIRGALIGLLIVVGAVLILNTINPQLKGLKALDGPPVNVEARIHGGDEADTIIIGESSGLEIQNLINNCENLITIRKDEYCCNDTNTCNIPTNTTPDSVLIGFDSSKIYSTAEVIELLTTNSSNQNILDLRILSTPQSEEQMERSCQTAASYRSVELSNIIVMQQALAEGGRRIIKQRLICVMK